MNNLRLLEDYRYYFQFTLNSYDKSVETEVPNKKELISSFIELSRITGKERVVWRYDPILLTDKFNKQYHYRWFEYLAERLHSYTNKCVISFIDLYSKTERNTASLGIIPFTADDMKDMAQQLSLTAKRYGLALETCSEVQDFSVYGIGRSRCIDDRLISSIIGKPLIIDRDPNQRKACGCVKSVDIGAYNTCRHYCLYCYANYSKNTVEKNSFLHDPKSPLLSGRLNGDKAVRDRPGNRGSDGDAY